jgi:hypothetical protein
MPVDTGVVDSWFDEYFGTFEACARGDRDMSELLRHYGVPLTFTSDAGVTTLMTDDEAAAMMQGLIDGLRANGYHHTDVLHPEVTILNSVSALYRATLSRRKADGDEFDCPTVTFLVTDDVAGLRVVLIAVQAK